MGKIGLERKKTLREGYGVNTCEQLFLQTLTALLQLLYSIAKMNF
jgi:hypothetical protein